MIQSFEKAFALKDNPFSPTHLLPGIPNNKRYIMRNLVMRPLLIYDVPALLKLFCLNAGQFEKNFHAFQELIELDGYSPDPPTAGLNPFIFLILGHKGTGKTTLANLMIHHLQKCQPDKNSKWNVFQEWADQEFNSSEQLINEIDQLEEKVLKDTTSGDYCCIAIDNLIEGAEIRALERPL